MSTNVWSLDGWTGYEGSFVDGDVVFHIERTRGWHSTAAPRLTGGPRPRGHGWNDGPSWRDARRVEIVGWLWARTEALLESAMESMAGICGDGERLYELRVDTETRSLTADVRLDDEVDVQPTGRWNAAVTLALLAPDPRRYATAVTPLSTPLQQPGGGIAPPWTPPLVLPERPAGGFVTAVNPGTAPTPLLVVLTGPQETPGVLNATTNQILRYSIDLDEDDELEIDTARGVAILNKTAYRSPLPGSTVTQNFQLPPKSSSDLQAIGTGTGDGAPRMDVEFRGAWW